MKFDFVFPLAEVQIDIVNLIFAKALFRGFNYRNSNAIIRQKIAQSSFSVVNELQQLFSESLILHLLSYYHLLVFFSIPSSSEYVLLLVFNLAFVFPAEPRKDLLVVGLLVKSSSA